MQYDASKFGRVAWIRYDTTLKAENDNIDTDGPILVAPIISAGKRTLASVDRNCAGGPHGITEEVASAEHAIQDISNIRQTHHFVDGHGGIAKHGSAADTGVVQE